MNSVTTEERLSASRLNCWLQCRLKYWFRYVEKIRKPKTASLLVGSVVHLLLKQWNKARWRKESLEVTEDHLSEHWEAEQQESTVEWKEGEQDTAKAQSWSLFQTYLNATPIPPNEKIEGVEVAVETDLASHGLPKLVGIIDLVREGGRIVDFKTTGQTPNPLNVIHQNEVQLSSYSLLYREATGNREGGLEIHSLVKTKKPKVVVTEMNPMTDNQQSRLFRQMEAFVNGKDDPYPSPGFHCSACDYFMECRRWSG